jgi:RNA polymerase sigma-70 factor (ECF subfamily)
MADLTAADFDVLRPRLTRIAYRMLGSWADAEDVVQDAWLRWQKTDRNTVRDPAAFLSRTVSRLSLDVLKSARAKRETYIGPWLPEPIVDEIEEDEDGITGTLMLALERLSPLERAAFLLHDVSGWISTKSPRPSTASLPPAASSRRGPAIMCAATSPVFR